MKNKTLFWVILFSLALVSCAPIPIPTPAPTATPQATAIITQANIPTSTPFDNENASDDCFLNVEFIPGKTEMKKVVSVWGNPSEKSSLGGIYEYWYFDFSGTPYISFDKQIIDTIRFSLKNCSLEKIIGKLGPPEKIEITIPIRDTGPTINPTTYRQDFHYQSLGYSFYQLCDEVRSCFTFHSTDTVLGKEFYSPEKIIKDSTGFNMVSYVYNWHGFDVDVETIENKMKDFSTSTPTP